MYLQSTPGNSSTVSILDGPIFEPMDGCHMIFWVNFEGNFSLTFNIERNGIGLIREVNTFQIYLYSNEFIYIRHIIEIPKDNAQYRAYFNGIV